MKWVNYFILKQKNKIEREEVKMKIVSLFSGAGGLDLGLVLAGK